MNTHPLVINNHWLDPVRQVVSPNFGERPDANDVDLVVVHSISLPPGQYGGDEIERFFCNQLDCTEHPYFQQIDGMQVSAHVLIRRTGELVQFVPFDRRAWHAGQSRYQGRDNCNDFSIGIEMEGVDTEGFEISQYQQLAALVFALEKHYPDISKQRITGHSDIAPGRKTDPGTGFDWGYFESLLNA